VAPWAHRNLPAKNTLTAADAKIVEERFQALPSTIGDWAPAIVAKVGNRTAAPRRGGYQKRALAMALAM
jgi:hypothetical protein